MIARNEDMANTNEPSGEKTQGTPDQEVVREVSQSEMARIFYIMLWSQGGELVIPKSELEGFCEDGELEATYSETQKKYFIRASEPKKKRKRGIIKPSKKLIVPGN